MNTKMVTSYLFCCILIISLMSVTADIVPEFQFPCYVDVCTFPRQYCNSDRNERRCSPCTRSLCQKDNLPRACLYYCRIANNQVATTSSPQKQREVESNWRDKSEVYLVYMVIFIAVTNTILVVVVLFTAIWLLRYCGKRGKVPLSPMQRFLSGSGERDIEMPLLEDGMPHGQREVVLRTVESEKESTKSEPLYKQAQFVNMPQDSSKSTDSADSDLDKQADRVNNSKRSSPVIMDKTIPVEEREFLSKAPLSKSYVSSPTGDRQHEYHEKPWPLGGNTKRFDSNDSVFRTEKGPEETCVKQ